MAGSPQRLGWFPPVYIRLPPGSERQPGHPAAIGGRDARSRGEPLVVDESGYQPIENYGVIGDLHTVALVGMDGSMDFCSFPKFDSPTIFRGDLQHVLVLVRRGCRPLR
jgi:hypothetical protein